MKTIIPDGIDIGAELSRILSREISKEISISRFDMAVNNQNGFDSAIMYNMYTYDECVGYDNKGAAESLTRTIQLIVMNIRNKHCQ